MKMTTKLRKSLMRTRPSQPKSLQRRRARARPRPSSLTKTKRSRIRAKAQRMRTLRRPRRSPKRP